MFQQPSHLQFTERNYGMRKQEGYQYSAQNQHQPNFPNPGKYKFGSLINQAQQNNATAPLYQSSPSNPNQSIQPHSIVKVPNNGINRVTKFIPPLKQEQGANVYVDTNQMPCGSNQMVPIFQNSSRYNNEMGQLNNTRNFMQPNHDASVTQSDFRSRMPPPPNPDRTANERFRKFDKMTAGFQDYDSMPLSRSGHQGTNEEVFNKSVQLQRAMGNCGSYGNPSMVSTPQLPRSISSAAQPIDAKISQMLSLTIDETQCTGNINNLNYKIFGCTEREKIFIFTGTVEKLMKWNKIFRNHFCYFEVIASVVSIQEGSVKTQKIMLLRDKKGPVLQVVYYLITHLDLRDFYIGQMIRCVGKMTGQNVFNAVSIRGASDEEVDNLQRLCLICDQAVSHYLNV